MNIPENLYYTKDHEWIQVNGNEGVVGVTDFAQHQLGDIVFIEVNTVGEILLAGDAFGTIEAVKTVSDVFMPVGGEVLEFNDNLSSKPELVNSDPYTEGWIAKIHILNIDQLASLLTTSQYKELVDA